jgi:hypothetical protein
MQKLIVSALVFASFGCLPPQKSLQSPTPYTITQPQPTPTIIKAKPQTSAVIDASASLKVLTEEGVVWATDVIDFSSEWSPNQWGTNQLIGPPDAFPMSKQDSQEWTDNPKAWAARDKDGSSEFITLGFGDWVDAKGIVIAETHSPGGIIRIEDSYSGSILWEGKSPTAKSQQVEMMRITFEAPQKIKGLRLVLDTNTRDYWEELDAVGLLLNQPPSTEQVAIALNELTKKRYVEVPDPIEPPPDSPPQKTVADEGAEVLASLASRQVVWANGVRSFSSEWAPDQWGAVQALGAPDLFPTCADEAKAWAATDADKGTEYLSLSFPATKTKGIVIAESLTPGGVIKVEDISNAGAPVVIWKGEPQKISEKCRIVELSITPREIRAVRITLNTASQPYWEEIDAVGLLPAK